MPVALEPGVRLPIVLEIDEDKPEATRPTFYVRALSRRQCGQFMERYDARFEGDNVTQAVVSQRLQALLEDLIIGWDNMRAPDGAAIPFSSEAIFDVLSDAEIRELILRCQMARYLKPEEKKSSV